MKKFLALLLALVMIFSLAACAGKAPDEEKKEEPKEETKEEEKKEETPAADGALTPKNGDKFKVAYLNRRNDNEFLVWLMDECCAKLEEDGRFDVATYDGMNDTQKQVAQIEDCITNDVDFLCIAVNDAAGTKDACIKLTEAGIPWFGISCEPDASIADQHYQIGIDHWDTGKMQGEVAAKLLPEGAKWVYCAGRSGSDISLGRSEGLKQALADAGRDDLELLAELECDYTAAQGQKFMEDWLVAFDEIDAVICVNDQSAYGCVQALKAANRIDECMVIGIDAETVMLEAIKAGEATATIKQDVPGHAEAFYDCICKLIDGEEIPNRVNIPLIPVTAENVDEYL